MLTLDDALTLALHEAEIKGLRNVYHIRFRAEHLKNILGAGTPVEHITETTIAKYVAHRHSKEKKSSTINRELAVLRAALKQAKKHKAIKELPEMPRYDEDNTRMVFF